MTATLRRATTSDADAMREVARAAYARYLVRMDLPPAPYIADYGHHVADDECWVAVMDDAVIGFVVLTAYDDHLLLDNIAVHPDQQGAGLGGALLDLVDRRAGELGLPEIRLFTHELMTENQAYYPRHGYTESHRVVTDARPRVYFTKPTPPLASSGPTGRSR